MPDWSDRVDRLLFEGEAVETQIDTATATVVVTSHRLLAFTPDGDGEDFRAVDLPNVRAVERRAVSDLDLLGTAAKLGVPGVLLVLVGIVVRPEALFPRPDVSGAPGTGGMLGPVQTGLDLFYLLDEALLGLGALLAIVAAALAGLQFATRTDRIVIEVAGGDDLHLPASGQGQTRADLARALGLPVEGQGNAHQRPPA